ncbi:MogA/MoaB family molybdenum cofactor biosynthesis protein [Halarsenatibacter silvermanii]|uniref:Molybdenum cofactor synthesis domain-containing protein n=1 Tax=Halarsenatibacter silvermanii TaxID=321763 RepID=A0A1G9PAI2_9FIRM|nr:MogA/MoaB family molybdenum cofactor biosynthesis protein [Halarsenatibacter silvermanii]SDL95217.1 molybdenum cofactor synthesis domain-containing protein [Halarsenatibacter silvermanii]
MKTTIITVSDKGAAGDRDDQSGPIIKKTVEEAGGEIIESIIIPDEKEQITSVLREMSDNPEIELIFTSGGTGFSPRDITPEATLEVIDREVPGLPEKMRDDTSKYTEMSYLSRARSGIRNQTLIINLPGSPEAVEQCLESIMNLIPHGLEILLGQVTEH